jgi:hypothetical protein
LVIEYVAATWKVLTGSYLLKVVRAGMVWGLAMKLQTKVCFGFGAAWSGHEFPADAKNAALLTAYDAW